MNQGQSIYSNNKEREICHFPTPCFRFFNENMPFFLTGTRAESTRAQRHAVSKKKKREEFLCPPF